MYILEGYFWRNITLDISINDLAFVLFLSLFTPLIRVVLAENNLFVFKGDKLLKKILFGIVNFLYVTSGIIMLILPNVIIIGLIMRNFFISNNLSNLLSTILVCGLIFLVLIFIFLFTWINKKDLSRKKYIKMLNKTE